MREARAEGEGVDGMQDARECAIGVGVRCEVREDKELELGQEIWWGWWGVDVVVGEVGGCGPGAGGRRVPEATERVNANDSHASKRHSTVPSTPSNDIVWPMDVGSIVRVTM